MGKTFDGIDIFFIVLISIYLIVLVLFITIFICNYYEVKINLKPTKNKNNKAKNNAKQTKKSSKTSNNKKATSTNKKKKNNKKTTKTTNKKKNYKANVSYVKNNPKKKERKTTK